MRDLSRFWQSLERIPGLRSVPAFWEEYCGADFELIRPHLRLTDAVAAAYPCPHPSSGHCPRRIIGYDGGPYAALCRDPHRVCPDVNLEPHDVLVHELDVGSFMGTVAAYVGLRCQPPVTRGDGTWAVGTSCQVDSRGQPMFLMVVPETGRFRAATEQLLLDVPGPFTILAPTNRHRTVKVQERLQSRGIKLLALEDHVAVPDDGRFAAINQHDVAAEPGSTPKEDRKRFVKEFIGRHQCKVRDIQEAAGVDEADYYKWLRGKTPDHYSTSVAIERVLQQGLPNRKPQACQ